jgi:hypothetical protein
MKAVTAIGSSAGAYALVAYLACKVLQGNSNNGEVVQLEF